MPSKEAGAASLFTSCGLRAVCVWRNQTWRASECVRRALQRSLDLPAVGRIDARLQLVHARHQLVGVCSLLSQTGAHLRGVRLAQYNHHWPARRERKAARHGTSMLRHRARC